MMKRVFTLFLLLGMFSIIVACSDNNNETKGASSKSPETAESSDNKGDTEKSSENDKKAEAGKSKKNLSLPNDVPGDFPIPEGIVITEIEDNSDEVQISYYIDFILNDIDVDKIFELYRDYSDKVGYTVEKDGEVEVLEGVYQFAALETAYDMFVITLRKNQGNGVIQIIIGK